MASISTHQKTGHVRICFKHFGKRRILHLGKVSVKVAERHLEQVVHLQSCVAASEPISRESLQWAAKLPDEIYSRYVRVMLLPPRQAPSQATVGDLVRDLNAELAPRKILTRENYERIFGMLVEKFGESRPVASITARDADAFVLWARTTKENAEPTVARRIRAWRMAFARAIRWEMTDANPFTGVKAGASVNHARKAFVAAETVDRLIEATQSPDMRAALALCRYGALRCPSEIVNLQWADVVWEEPGRAGKINVKSPKTEHHAGGAGRELPLFPRLAEVLAQVLLDAPDGSKYVLQRRRSAKTNLRMELTRLLKRLGILPWPKLFQNMRASRESELYRMFPLPVVCKWLGHTPEVAAVHYILDTDNDANFLAASQMQEGSLTRPMTRAKAEVGGSLGKQGEARNAQPSQVLEVAGVGGSDQCAQLDSKGASRTPEIVANDGNAKDSDAPSDARRAVCPTCHRPL